METARTRSNKRDFRENGEIDVLLSADEDDNAVIADSPSLKNYLSQKISLVNTRKIITEKLGENEDVLLLPQFLRLIETFELQAARDQLENQRMVHIDEKLSKYVEAIDAINQEVGSSDKKNQKMQIAKKRLIRDIRNILYTEQSERRTILLRVLATFATALLACYLTGGLSLIVTAASQCAASVAAPSLQAVGIAAAGTVGSAAAVWFMTEPRKPVGESARFFKVESRAKEFSKELEKHYTASISTSSP